MSPGAVDASDTTINGNGAASGTRLQDPGIVPTPTVTGPWAVDKVLDTLPDGKYEENSTSPLPYFHLLERLKTSKREGWRRFDIMRGESIADHMYRMSLMSMLAPPALAARLDMHKCMQMCLIHDMAESLVGDITPVDGVEKPEKSRRESSTMDYITQRLLGNVHGSGGSSAVGERIRAVWQEYEDSQTLESHYVHDIDKMELLLQMVEYEKRGQRRIDLGEFAYVATKIVLPEVKEWAKEILQERKDFWADQEHVDGSEEVNGGVATSKKEMQDAYYSREGEQKAD